MTPVLDKDISERSSHKVGQSLLTSAAVVLVLASQVLRFAWLDHVPGLNGDEADTAVGLQFRMVGVRANSRTPTGNFFNPLLIASEWFMLKCFPRSTFNLCLPGAAWATVLLMCMPLHMAFSWLNWDTTYSLLGLCRGALPSAGHRQSNRQLGRWGLLLIGVSFSLWVHPTFAVFLGIVFAIATGLADRTNMDALLEVHMHVFAVLASLALTLCWTRLLQPILHVPLRNSSSQRGMAISRGCSIVKWPRYHWRV